MTTQTLRGLRGLDPLHWRGDRANFLAFNNAFHDLLGGTNLSNVDMAAYRSFINSIEFQPNPNQQLDRTLPTELAGGNPVVGRSSFQNFVFDARADVRCITCHNQLVNAQLPAGNGTPRLIMADERLQAPQHLKVPHLRNLYQKTGFVNTPGRDSINGFGFAHDGRDATLFDMFVAPRFGVLTNNDSSVTIYWPTNALGVVLEFSDNPAAGRWTVETSVRTQESGSFTVTVPAGNPRGFYRLRRL